MRFSLIKQSSQFETAAVLCDRFRNSENCSSNCRWLSWSEIRTASKKNLAALGFALDTYSPHFSLVDEAVVNYCQERNIKIVTWTVNETADLERMSKFDLDGIITDYPDRAVNVFRR